MFHIIYFHYKDDNMVMQQGADPDFWYIWG